MATSAAPDVAARRLARYQRQRGAVIGLLVACLALLVIAFSQADRIIVYDTPEPIGFAGKRWLACEESTLVEREPSAALRDLDDPDGAPVRRVGRAVAVAALADRLYVAAESGLSIYDERMGRIAFVPLPKPDKAPAVVAILACREVDGVLRVVGRTEHGLVAGRLADGALAFSAPTEDVQSETIRELRIVRTRGKLWALWVSPVDAAYTRVGCARWDGDALVEARQQDMAGLALDFASLDGAADAPATVFMNLRVPDAAAKLVVTAFDGKPALATPVTLEYAESAWPRGPILGLAAQTTPERTELFLARLGSIERIHAPSPRHALPWSGPEHLAGIGQIGRALAMLLVVVLVACSTLVVVAGLGLLRDRPPRVEMPPPFRLSAETPPAPLWLRGSAFALDMILVLPALVAAGQHLSGTTDIQELSLMSSLLPLQTHLLFCAIYLPYDLACELRFGGSVGKLLFGLSVVDHTGQTPSRKATVVRSLSKMVDTALLLGVLPMIVSPLHQRFGDIWADTLVVATDADDDDEL